MSVFGSMELSYREHNSYDTSSVNVNYSIDIDALNLDTIFEKFEFFLRAAGFDYVRMYRDDGAWVFDKNNHENYMHLDEWNDISDWYDEDEEEDYSEEYDEDDEEYDEEYELVIEDDEE